MNSAIGGLFARSFQKNVKTEMVFHPSAKCLECGSRLTSGRDNPDASGSHHPDTAWHCPNPDCPAQIRVRVAHWCSREAMDIAGVDAALIAKLVAAGLVRDLSELYRLKVSEIAGLEGMDKNSTKQLLDAIAASRKREAWQLLFGLSIPDLTAAEAQSLSRHFGSVDNIFAAGVERLLQAEGVREESARNLHHWHGDSVNRRLVKRLFKAGLNFKAG